MSNLRKALLLAAVLGVAAKSFEFNEAKLVLSDLGNSTLVVLAPK